MGLTSNTMLVLAVLSAVLLFAGTVWVWPRLARRSWRAVGGRVGLLLGTQLALFAAVGLAANQAFGFYASWADLFGQEKDQGVVVDHTPGGGPLEVVGSRRVPGRAVRCPRPGAGSSRSTSSAVRPVSPRPRTCICRRSTFSRGTAPTGFPRRSC